MFKIDLKKWRAALAAAEEKRAAVQRYAEAMRRYGAGELAGKDLPPYTSAERVAEEFTKLYSIRAHARGRLHRRSARLTYADARRLTGAVPAYEAFTAANGSLVLALDLEAQARYIGETWRAFEREEGLPPEVVAVAKLLAR